MLSNIPVRGHRLTPGAQVLSAVQVGMEFGFFGRARTTERITSAPASRSKISQYQVVSSITSMHAGSGSQIFDYIVFLDLPATPPVQYTPRIAQNLVSRFLSSIEVACLPRSFPTYGDAILVRSRMLGGGGLYPQIDLDSILVEPRAALSPNHLSSIVPYRSYHRGID